MSNCILQVYIVKLFYLGLHQVFYTFSQEAIWKEKKNKFAAVRLVVSRDIDNVGDFDVQAKIQAELALAGAQCRGERHEQVIARQRDALVELRAKIRALESANIPSKRLIPDNMIIAGWVMHVNKFFLTRICSFLSSFVPAPRV